MVIPIIIRTFAEQLGNKAMSYNQLVEKAYKRYKQSIKDCGNKDYVNLEVIVRSMANITDDDTLYDIIYAVEKKYSDENEQK